MKGVKGGQYNKKKATADEQEGKYFRLGQEAAKVEGQRKENEQLAQMNMIQSIMLQEKTNQLKDILADITRKQQMLDEQMMQMMAPPLEGAPLPGLPPELGGMPPEMMGGGMPPGMMGGGMPPEMMGGGMPPEMMGMPPGGPPMGPGGGGQPLPPMM